MDVKRLLKLARRMPDVPIRQAVQFITLLAAAEKSEDLAAHEVKAICAALGQAFNKIRRTAGLTRRQFCEKSKITDGWLTAIEQGRASLNAYPPALFNVMLFGSENMAEELLAEYEKALGPRPTMMDMMEPQT